MIQQKMTINSNNNASNKQNNVANLQENYYNSNYENNVMFGYKKVSTQNELSKIYSNNTCCNNPNIQQTNKATLSKEEKKKVSYQKPKNSKGMIDYKTYSNSRQEEQNTFHTHNPNYNNSINNKTFELAFNISNVKEDQQRNKDITQIVKMGNQGVGPNFSNINTNIYNSNNAQVNANATNGKFTNNMNKNGDGTYIKIKSYNSPIPQTYCGTNKVENSQFNYGKDRIIDQQLQEKKSQNKINNNGDGYHNLNQIKTKNSVNCINYNDGSNQKESQVQISNGMNVQNFNQIINANGKVINNYYNSNNGKYIIRENIGKSNVKIKSTVLNGK